MYLTTKRKTIAKTLIISCWILSLVLNADAQIVAKAIVSGEVTNVNIASDNENSSFARTGDVVTLSFTASSDLTDPVVSIAGRLVTVTSVSATEYAARLTMTAADTIQGAIPFSIMFKNPVRYIDATTDNSVVYFDNLRPTVNLFAIVKAPVVTPFMISISFSEAIKNFNTNLIRTENAVLSDFNHVRNNLITATVTPLHDGEVTIMVPDSTATDAAGNPNIASSLYTTRAGVSGMFDKVYPNPASTMLTVKYIPAINLKAMITLMNYNGVVVYEKEMVMDGVIINIDVSRFPSGMYMLFTKSNDYSFYTNVIIAH
jgi:hypothetical protein